MFAAPFLPLAALAPFASAEFGLAGQLFQLADSSSVNSVKLGWAPVSGASSYRVEQSTGSGSFQSVATVSGDTHDIYDLSVGQQYSFRITALAGVKSQVDQSSVTTLSPFEPDGTYNTYDNTEPSDFLIKPELEADGVYYRYNYETADDGSFARFVEQTSTDGYTFSGDRTVLTSETVCASVDDGCKLERVQAHKNPTNGWFVLWAHFERASDYGLGQVAVAHVETPGEGDMVFDGTFQPKGNDSRDFAFFADGEDAYIVSATDVNANNNSKLADSLPFQQMKGPLLTESPAHFSLLSHLQLDSRG